MDPNLGETESEYESETPKVLNEDSKLKTKRSQTSFRRSSVHSEASKQSSQVTSGSHHYRALVDDNASVKSESSFKREQTYKPERGMAHSLRGGDDGRARSQSVTDRMSLKSFKYAPNADNASVSSATGTSPAASPSRMMSLRNKPNANAAGGTRSRSQSITDRFSAKLNFASQGEGGTGSQPFKSRFADSDSDIDIPVSAPASSSPKKGKISISKVFSPNTDVKSFWNGENAPRSSEQHVVDTSIESVDAIDGTKKKKTGFFKRLFKHKK